MQLDSKIPAGPVQEKWTKYRFDMKLVNPANKRKHTIIVVGTGLAGASAAATMGELGYNVLSFCYQDSPRRAHSIAAQGGINAARGRKVDNRVRFSLRPPVGGAVVFDHLLLHEGAEVTSGTKYAVRSDLVHAHARGC